MLCIFILPWLHTLSYFLLVCWDICCIDEHCDVFLVRLSMSRGIVEFVVVLVCVDVVCVDRVLGCFEGVWWLTLVCHCFVCLGVVFRHT